MRKTLLQIPLLFLWGNIIYAQTQTNIPDSNINNQVHTSGYKPSKWGAIPSYTKAGNGKQTLILIPGMGFDASVFSDFINANKKNYTIYAITIPGYGKTAAPAMPDSSVSYGEQSWNKGILEGISKLIEKKKLDKPVVVGHFLQGSQLALRMAIDYPDKVGSVIVLGGTAKMMAIMQDKLVNQSLKDMIRGTDQYFGPQWFRHMKKSFYDNGNFVAEVYSVNAKTADSLWKQVAAVPMPVAVRYSCEYFASDVLAEIEKIKCPVLVLRGTFSEKFWENPMNKNWIQPQFIESWNMAANKNALIQVRDMQGAAAFVWKDKPDETYLAIKEFLNKQQQVK